MTNLDGIFKSRDNTWPTKVHLIKAMVFPVVMYGCENWTIRKAERQRIDVFELWCWRRLLRVPCTARRSNQSILKEISPEYSFEGLMLKPKLQYSGHLMWRTDSLEKSLMLGKIEGGKKRGRQKMKWLDGITDFMDMSLSKLWKLVDRRGSLACCSPWGQKESDTTQLSDWTESSRSSACEITQPMKTNHNTSRSRTCPLQWPTLCLWNALLSQSESIHFSPITLSLTEFFLQWGIKNLTSLGPETRYVGFVWVWANKLVWVESNPYPLHSKVDS